MLEDKMRYAKLSVLKLWGEKMSIDVSKRISKRIGYGEVER